MKTFREVILNVISRALSNPKTTLQAIITCCMFWSTFFAICGCVSVKYALISGAFLSTLKMYIGASQRDNTTLTVPANTKVIAETHTEVVTPNTGEIK